MDKIDKYQQAIIGFLREYAAIPSANANGVEDKLVFDTSNNHFQLLSVGWDKSKFVFGAVFHFDIVGDKVWIQQNNTEVFVADELMSRGIERNDIVLGFQAPYARVHSGFATA